MVLAGGRGSRLMQLTDWRAKPAVPFGGKFRIIDFTLSNCVNSGIRRIGVLTQYKAQSLIHHIQRGWSFLDGRFNEQVDLLPAQQQMGDKWYQGTADAVYQNLDVIQRHHLRHVLVLSGDHIYKMDYGPMLIQHAERNADLTVACMEVPVEDAREFGVVAIDDQQRITSFVEKPANPPALSGRPDRAMVSMGIYVFNADFLCDELIRDSADANSSHDFGKDLLPRIVSKNRVFAHNFANSCVGVEPGKLAYWRDVGTVDAYWEANIELTRMTPELNVYDEVWPIWTYQEQLPPAKFVFDDDGRRGMAVDSVVSGGAIISGATVRRSVLFSRVRVHSYASVENSVILPSVDIGRGARLRKVIVDKHCRIPPGMVIGFNPEEDRRHFQVSPKGVTLVTPAMLGQKALHFR